MGIGAQIFQPGAVCLARTIVAAMTGLSVSAEVG